MTRVLVVDDEPTLVRALAINLRARSYQVTTAATGREALKLAAQHPPDVVILDLGLPDMDGTEVIAGLRGWTQVPIVVLSARDRQDAKVNALDAGADDFIVKPFGMDELLARLRAALRRAAPVSAEPVVVTDDFTVDLAAKRVSTASGEVKLTPTEWHLLEVLVRHADQNVEHQTLLQEVWGPAYTNQANYLRVYIAALRRKLEPDPGDPRYLLTASGLGYRFQLHP
jgi:two-component system, OmpR family, KDP operon response regulator KdpE